jgi:hypothetical protein
VILMSEEQTSAKSFPAIVGKWLPLLIGIFFGGLLLLSLLNLMVGPGLYRMLEVLPLGWLAFCRRTFPAMEWSGDLLGMAVVCGLAIGVVLHWIMRWLTAYAAARFGAAWTWPWRWSVCGLAAGGILFLIGTSVAGMVNQARLMMDSTEPRLAVRESVRADMKMLQMAFDEAMIESDGDLTRAASRLWKDEVNYLHRFKAREKYQIYVLRKGDGKYLSHIIRPRDAQKFQSAGGYAVDEKDWGPKTASEITEIMEQNRNGLLAL